jgi:hypothetical protein
MLMETNKNAALVKSLLLLKTSFPVSIPWCIIYKMLPNDTWLTV